MARFGNGWVREREEQEEAMNNECDLFIGMRI